MAPDSIEVGTPVTVTTHAFDEDGLAAVALILTDPAGAVQTIPLLPDLADGQATHGFTPTLAGHYRASVTATDTQQQTSTRQRASLVQTSDTLAPQVKLSVDAPAPLLVGHTVTIHVTATDARDIHRTTLTINGTSVPLTSAGTATYMPTAVGVATLVPRPPMRRDMIRQQFVDAPTLIRDARHHRRGAPSPDGSETRMWRANIRDRTKKIHAMLQRQRVTRQRTAAASQRGQPLTACGVQALNRGRIDDSVALRAPSERLDACRRAINNAACSRDRPPSLRALDDVGDHDMAPGTQPGSSTRACGHRVAEALPNGSDGRHHAIGTDQQGAMGRTAPHAFDQSSDQRHVPLLADLTAQPQAGVDHHRSGHPDNAALFFDPDRIGVHLA